MHSPWLNSNQQQLRVLNTIAIQCWLIWGDLQSTGTLIPLGIFFAEGQNVVLSSYLLDLSRPASLLPV